MQKTNVIRLLEQANIPFAVHEYDEEETVGENVAKLVNKSPDEVFKTLVTVCEKNEHYVFVVPVSETLNLKKAAKAVGAKSIEMIKQKELLPLTGYIHGGCSPIGMKKQFHTVIDETAQLFDTICVSAGKKGLQIELSPIALAKYVNAEFCDII